MPIWTLVLYELKHCSEIICLYFCQTHNWWYLTQRKIIWGSAERLCWNIFQQSFTIDYLPVHVHLARTNQPITFYFKETLQIQHNRQSIRKWFRITRLQDYNGVYIYTYLCIPKTATGISLADNIILISAIKLQNLNIVRWIRLNHSLP